MPQTCLPPNGHKEETKVGIARNRPKILTLLLIRQYFNYYSTIRTR